VPVGDHRHPLSDGGAATDTATIGLGVGGFLAGALVARHVRVSGLERTLFEAVNALPSGAHAPIWAVMQLGSLGGALGTGAAIALAGRPSLGRQAAAVGAVTWGTAKVVKRFVGRERPMEVVGSVRVLGRASSGLGYPSGHAAVAASMAAIAAPALPREWRPVAWAGALLVGPARMYVGAHLPLDVVGGVALGVAIAATSRRLSGRPSAITRIRRE
jgi:undecaprenyl-diphosphatase